MQSASVVTWGRSWVDSRRSVVLSIFYGGEEEEWRGGDEGWGRTIKYITGWTGIERREGGGGHVRLKESGSDGEKERKRGK